MKAFYRRLLTGCLISLLAPLSALAANQDEIYFGAASGQTSVHIDSNSDSGKVNQIAVSQYFPKDQTIFSLTYVELDQYEHSTPIENNIETLTNYDVNGLILSAGKYYEISRDIYLTARLGLIHWQESQAIESTDSTDAENPVTTQRDDEISGNSVYISGGMSFSINDHSRIDLQVERYETDNVSFNNTLVGISFRI